MHLAMPVRAAAPDDSKALAQVQVDSYVTSYMGILPEEYLAQFTYAEQENDWRALLTRQTGEIVLVAPLPTGEIAGYVLGWEESDSMLGFDAQLAALHVRAAQRRRGIGSALTRAAALRLRALGRRSLMLWVLEDNAGARAFWERLGGQVVSESEWDGNEEYETHVHEVAYGWDDISTLCP